MSEKSTTDQILDLLLDALQERQATREAEKTEMPADFHEPALAETKPIEEPESLRVSEFSESIEFEPQTDLHDLPTEIDQPTQHQRRQHGNKTSQNRINRFQWGMHFT